MTLFLSYVAIQRIRIPNKIISRKLGGLLRTGTSLIDDCTKEEMYQVLAALVVNVDELREKDPSLADLKTYYRMMLACQLKDWKAKNVEP